MKGVVRPHARPTRRKPSVQLRIEGGGGGDSVSVDMFALEVWWERVAEKSRRWLIWLVRLIL